MKNEEQSSKINNNNEEIEKLKSEDSSLFFFRKNNTRLLILILMIIVLFCLVYWSYSLSLQYISKCESVYSLESDLALVKSEYNALVNNQKETLSLKKTLEKSVIGSKSTLSSFQVSYQQFLSNILNKAQKIETLKAQLNHRQDLMIKYSLKEKYEIEIKQLKGDMNGFELKIEQLKHKLNS